jgi:hypothetical protein
MSKLLKKSYAALFTKGDFSVSAVADKISEEFEIGRGKNLISAENLALLVTELACERISSRTALITLNQPPLDNPQEARKTIDDLCFDRFDQLLKISSRTKESNVARATHLPGYAEFALYVAHVRLFERDGKNPGWRKLAKRASDILGRSPYKRSDWEPLITKSRIEKLLPSFREATEKSDYPKPDYVAWATEYDWLM